MLVILITLDLNHILNPVINLTLKLSTLKFKFANFNSNQYNQKSLNYNKQTLQSGCVYSKFKECNG